MMYPEKFASFKKLKKKKKEYFLNHLVNSYG